MRSRRSAARIISVSGCFEMEAKSFSPSTGEIARCGCGVSASLGGLVAGSSLVPFVAPLAGRAGVEATAGGTGVEPLTPAESAGGGLVAATISSS